MAELFGAFIGFAFGCLFIMIVLWLISGND